MNEPVGRDDVVAPSRRTGGAIVCFYASSRYGSEYRSGLDFIGIAWQQGFDLAIVSDVEHNDGKAALEARFPGLTVLVVPSPVRQQRLLYRFTDLLPQMRWHRRVAAMLRRRASAPTALWIANSAQPWLPLATYEHCFADRLIWGPIGGGGGAPDAYLATCGRSTRWRERLRGVIERKTMAAKIELLGRLRRSGRSIEIMARTREVAAVLTAGGAGEVPIVAEIVAPLQPQTFVKPASDRPRLIWVGQDIPRKNLAMALSLFSRLRTCFPALTIDIHGVRSISDDPAITYHGWTPGVPWDGYRDGGILLLTSYREGLPSAVLEALNAGLACISTDVGAIGTLRPAPVFLIPMATYPDVDDRTLADMADFIRKHTATTDYRLEEVDYTSTIVGLIATGNDQ